jgi:antitoxin MazE
MVTKLQKWGNSQGLRLSKRVLEEAQLAQGDTVDVAVQDGVIIIAPARGSRGRASLKDLVRRIPADYRPEGVGWGRPMGKEAW